MPSSGQLRRRHSAPTALLLVTLLLAGCGAGSEAGPEGTSDAREVTISGRIIQVGGPSNGKPYPLSATAAAYVHGNRSQQSVSGSPVAEVRSSARDSGRFQLTVPAGVYYVVAEAPASAVHPGTTTVPPAGTVISAPHRVDARSGDPAPITIEVAVP